VLVEAEGDLGRAVELLRERGIVKARGKAGRSASDGRVSASVSSDGRIGSLIEVNCETDFVAKTDDFGALVQSIAEAVRDQAPADVGALLALDSGGTRLEDRVVEAVAKLGENIQVRRLARIEAPANGRIESYVHAGGKIAALVQLEAEDPSRGEVQQLGRNLCMHVTATNPLSVSRDDLPAAEVEAERSALQAQARQEGKPEKIIDKMVEGRLRKFFQDVVLLEQPLVMDPDQTVEAALKAGDARAIAFRRFQLGEELPPGE